MKKIATITFHWAVNYGAVLQAFALQKYLLNNGYETEIINYTPTRMKLVMAIISLKKHDISFFIKERRIKSFRKKEMKLSKKYSSNRKLKKCSNIYDAIIAGSDQIWNQSFTLGAEGKPTLSYFLNFANESTRRIAYAVSFGSPEVNNEYKSVVASEIEKFYSISVREISGKKIVNNFGKPSEVVCDPTLLLDAEVYSALAEKTKEIKKLRVFPYIINSSKELPQKISTYISGDQKMNFKFNEGVYEWLETIKNAETVVTNSFHGVVFSIIFHKPFIATLIEGSGMNDRITTLLNFFSLEDRIIINYNEDLIDNLLKKEIDWNLVDKKLNELKNVGINFLNKSLGEQ